LGKKGRADRLALVRRGFLLVVVLVVGLSACRVDADVAVSVRSDGSGTVTARVRLDAAAVRGVEAFGTRLDDAVRLSDLTAAGWKSSGWVRRKDGGAVLTLSKGFTRAEDAGAVVAELNGPDGPIQKVRVTRSSSTFSSDWSFAGVADLKDLKSGIATDAPLVEKLTAARVDVAGLDQRVLAQTREALRLRVTADLPEASAKVFPVRPGTTVVMHTSSSARATTRIIFLVVGVALGVIAIVLLVAGELRSRRRRTA
jgi:hypothetical protein